MKILNWIKTHKLVLILVLVISYLVFKNSFTPVFLGTSNDSYSGITSNGGMNYGAPQSLSIKSFPVPSRQSAPQMDISERKVVTESHVSMLVKDVRQTLQQITHEVTARKGYIVNTYVNFPEGGANGYVTLRVPASELNSLLEKLRSLSIRVVSENISGHDVTDKFVDIQARLDTLNKTKAMYEGILDRATNVDEILRVQQSLLSVQDQIDSYQGQLTYIEATTSSTLITINLSTDELALPYAPEQPWRPEVIFKHAVRSLVGFGRFLGSAVIWLGVYSVIWLPILLIWIWWKKRRNPM